MPPDWRLTKTQRNDVYEILVEAKVEPSSFEWSEPTVGDDLNGYRRISQITHASSGYFAQFDYLASDGQPYFLLSPGISIREERYSPAGATPWRSHAREIQNWAERLKREIDADDLWGWIAEPRLLTAPDAFEDRFNDDDITFLTGKLESVRRLLLDAHAQSQQQQAAVNDRLDYLVDATKKQGRRDWYFLALGVIVQLAAQLTLPPETTTHIWQLITTGLPPLLHG